MMIRPLQYIITVEPQTDVFPEDLEALLNSWHALRLSKHCWYLDSGFPDLAEPLIDELRKYLGAQDQLFVMECQAIASWNANKAVPTLTPAVVGV
ncbi:hypothetical protein [Gallaecimonas mangrovi]|uniref:hypothetical protein n=1 Tax=Gallaecimonas mangrovi TaxID=2291597 RepID=UPI000E1FDA17|nr:hypothetical protein [Gallaecimonas mangrovi]